MSDKSEKESRDEMNSLRLIHISLLSGLLLFLGALIFFMNHPITLDYPTQSMPFLILNIFLLLPPLLIVPYLKRKFGISEKRHNKSVKEVKTYLPFKISQWAIYEGSAMFGLISFLLTGNALYLFFVGLHLALLIMNGPSKKELEE